MSQPENKKGKCAGFVQTDTPSDFLPYTGKLTICSGSGQVISSLKYAGSNRKFCGWFHLAWNSSVDPTISANAFLLYLA